MPPKDSMNLDTKKFKDYAWVPSSWDHHSVQSLKSDYTKESKYGRRAEELKDEVRRMLVDKQKVSLSSSSSSYDLLKLINILQRLGVGYHFGDEIKGALGNMKDRHFIWEKEDLFMQAVKFRLLRQHGYPVSPDVFKSFMEKTTSSKNLSMKACMGNNKDIEGILSVYEASFYAFQGESILDEIQEFSASFLKEYFILIQADEEEGKKEEEEGNNLKIVMKRLVSHALELPLHWRMQRLECKWFIETYEMMREDLNPLLLEFAKLDFNIVVAGVKLFRYLEIFERQMGGEFILDHGI
ncbi:hypothetical protein MKX03_001159 [Papaver bracteatum]|nr:hypothetical protein MKX03_001159 [Papaver bracteatum]